MCMKSEKKMIGILEAASRLGTTEVSVLMHLRAGKFAGAQEEGRWRVDLESLEAFLADGGGADKKLCKSHCAGKSANCACG